MNNRPKNPESTKGKHHKHHRSTNKLFDHPEQNVTVTVTVEQPKEDCLSGCFSALAGCFKKGASSG